MTLSDKRNALHQLYLHQDSLDDSFWEFGILELILGSQFWGADFWVLVLTFDNHASLEFLDLPEFPSAGLVYVLFSVGYLSFPLNSYFN